MPGLAPLDVAQRRLHILIVGSGYCCAITAARWFFANHKPAAIADPVLERGV